MKLTETVTIGTEFNESLLTEALRVSNTDIQKMMRLNQNDFLIGVEYEFHLNDSVRANNDSSVDMQLDTATRDQAWDQVEERVRDSLTPFARIGAAMIDIFADGNDFIEALAGEGTDEDATDEEKLTEFANLIHKTKLTFSTALEGDPVFEQALPSDLTDAMKEVYEDRISINVPEMVDRFLRKNEDVIEKMLDGIEDVIGYSTQFNQALRHAVNYVTRDSDWFSDEVDAEASHLMVMFQDDEELGNQGGNIDFVKSTLPDSIKSSIRGVELDSSVTDGVEVITKELRPTKALEVMGEMFDYIKEYGSTSNKTGLHINISHRSFVSGRPPDPLKIIALMDTDAFQDATNVKRHVKYPERSHMVEQLTSDLAHEGILSSIARGYLDGGLSGMEDMMKHVIVRSNKYKSVNWTHFLKDYDPSQKRIEMRFFGGESYENRFKEISQDMMFIMYVIQAVTNSSYKPEVYYRGLYRILDRAAKRGGLSSFNDVLQSTRRGAIT